jgi:hypothetical protein
MAHFAKLENNIVTQVIVVDDNDTRDASGVEIESIGQAFCTNLLGGEWKQTSYSGKIRKHYAGIGYSYDGTLDAFIPPQPYPSWVLNDKFNWEAPVAYPPGGVMHTWDEALRDWISVPQ